jgi:hypothetical protein
VFYAKAWLTYLEHLLTEYIIHIEKEKRLFRLDCNNSVRSVMAA